MNGLSTKDAMAACCSEEELTLRMPKTVGDIEKDMASRGMIDGREAPFSSLRTRYSNQQYLMLRCIYRYEYARDMLAASNSKMS